MAKLGLRHLVNVKLHQPFGFLTSEGSSAVGAGLRTDDSDLEIPVESFL